MVERTPLCRTAVFNCRFCGCCVSKSCVSFVSLDVVSNEHSYAGMYEFVNEFVHGHGVKCLAYVKY